MTSDHVYNVFGVQRTEEEEEGNSCPDERSSAGRGQHSEHTEHDARQRGRSKLYSATWVLQWVLQRVLHCYMWCYSGCHSGCHLATVSLVLL